MKFEYCGKKIMGLMPEKDLSTNSTEDNKTTLDTIPTLEQARMYECPLNRKMRRDFKNRKTICYYCMQSKENTN